MKDRRQVSQAITGAALGAARGRELAKLQGVLADPHLEGPDRAQTLREVLAGASMDDLQLLQEVMTRKGQGGPKVNPDEALARDWRDGGYPYQNLMRRATYEAQKYQLQVELLKLQAWVKESGQRVVILFEGRDAAGKGGAIKRFMEHLNPRGARVVALEKPSDVEKGQWYFQRYVQHLPTAGEIVLFDRSWYNRAGVERVMDFCSEQEYQEFMLQAPEFERHLVRSGVYRSSSGSRSARPSNAAASRSGRCTHSSSGSSARWTWLRSTSGTTTPVPRRRCSSRPTPPRRRGR